MNYQNIFNLQKAGYTFEQAEELESRGITLADTDKLDAYEEEQNAIAEYQQDLEDRGFLLGTDNPHVIARIEAQEAFDDKYAMYMNEY